MGHASCRVESEQHTVKAEAIRKLTAELRVFGWFRVLSCAARGSECDECEITTHVNGSDEYESQSGMRNPDGVFGDEFITVKVGYAYAYGKPCCLSSLLTWVTLTYPSW